MAGSYSSKDEPCISSASWSTLTAIPFKCTFAMSAKIVFVLANVHECGL